MPNPAVVSVQSTVGTLGTSIAFHNSSNGLSSGNCMVFPVYSWWDSGVPGRPSVTDNNGNTYTWAAGGARAALDGVRVDIFYSPPLSAGFSANAYTATVVANAANSGSGTNEIYGALIECSGFGALGPAVDVSGFVTQPAPASSTASVTLSGGTSKQAVELIICALHFNDSTNPDGIALPAGTGTWISSGIITNAAANLAVGSAYQLTSATGTAYNASWSGLDTTTNNGGTAVIAALYPASAATPSVPYMPYAFQPTMAQ